jgi:hypothetical protein
MNLSEQSENREVLKDYLPGVWTEYQQLIDPRAKVMVVGPSDSMFIDPSLLFITTLIDPDGDGEIFAVDPKSDFHPKTNNDPDLRVRIAGPGNLSNYEREITKMQQIGFNLKTPDWINGQLLNYNLPTDLKLFCICDHDTTSSVVYFGKNNYFRDPYEIYNEYYQVFSSYWQALIPGGAVIFQTDNSYYGLSTGHGNVLSIPRIFHEIGFKEVRYKKVKDRFIVPFPNQLVNPFLDNLVTPRVRDLSLFNRRNIVQIDKTQMCLDFWVTGKSTQSPSPDLYIAFK